MVQPTGAKLTAVSPPPKKNGLGDSVGKMDEIATLKRTLEEAKQELAEIKGSVKAAKTSRQEVCLDFLAGEYGVKYGTANSPWSCRLGHACSKIHPKGKEEGWKLVKKAEWLNWPVTGTTEAKLADLVPSFDETWA